MTPLFADGFFFLALLNKTDRAHEGCKDYLRSSTGRPLVTTAWVLTEVADGLSRPGWRVHVVRLVEILRASPGVEILAPDLELFFPLRRRSNPPSVSLHWAAPIVPAPRQPVREPRLFKRRAIWAG
jgi:predicted nucleic acid-binding protein